MSPSEPSPRLGERFMRGLERVFALHGDQARKTAADEGAGVSYLGHLLGVAAIVIDAGGSEEQVIAALLHDAAEDQGGKELLAELEREFGAVVARIVAECSDTFEEPKPPWRRRKEAYLANLAEVGEDTLLVSLADKLYNVRAILLDYRADGEAVWQRFNPDADPLWYYRSLAARFSELRPGVLAAELERTVRELCDLVAASRATDSGAR